MSFLHGVRSFRSGFKQFVLQAPRLETLYLFGSMIYLLELYSNVLLPQLGTGEGQGNGVLGSQLKEKLVETLFKAARKEPLRQSRYACVCVYVCVCVCVCRVWVNPNKGLT